MLKLSSTYSDVAGAMVPSLIFGGVNPALSHALGMANTAGIVHGALSDPSDKQIKELDKNTFKSYIPGVGTSRIARRRKAQGAPTSKVISQAAGSLTSSLLLTAIAAVIGGVIGKKSGGSDAIFPGALIGAVAGGVGSNLINLAAGVGAGITRTRTREQQEDYDKSTDRTIQNYLIPGASTYNLLKSLGRLHKDQQQNIK